MLMQVIYNRCDKADRERMQSAMIDEMRMCIGKIEIEKKRQAERRIQGSTIV
jgi:hypothetical protein